MYHGTVIILTLGPSETRASGLGIRGSPPPALCTYPCGGGWWGCGAQERERWCVERQVLRVILIPMDSAQRVKDANLKKSETR